MYVHVYTDILSKRGRCSFNMSRSWLGVSAKNYVHMLNLVLETHSRIVRLSVWLLHAGNRHVDVHAAPEQSHANARPAGECI